MNKSFLVSAICLLSALALMMWGFREPEVPEKDAPKYFALMTEDIGTEVLQFKQGAQAAAKELGASVTFLTCTPTSPVETELRALLNTLAPLSPDGIVIPRGGEVILSESMQMNVPVVCLFSTEAAGAVSVVTDFYALGAELGSRAASADPPEFAVFLEGGEDEEKMLEGLRSAINAPIRVITVSPEEAIAEASDLPDGTVVIVLNDALTLSLSGNSRYRLWGVDPGEQRVALLKGGAVQGLAMQMPYATGYLAIMALAAPPGADVYTPARVVTPDQIYRSENVKLMFPLLQ